MNTNINRIKGCYSAIVSGWQGDDNINWGFNVSEEHGSVFTAELAKELLENEELGVYTTLEDAYNVYSAKKEENIKQIADEYKELIPEKLYVALYNYKVKIENDKNYVA